MDKPFHFDTDGTGRSRPGAKAEAAHIITVVTDFGVQGMCLGPWDHYFAASGEARDHMGKMGIAPSAITPIPAAGIPIASAPPRLQ